MWSGMKFKIIPKTVLYELCLSYYTVLKKCNLHHIIYFLVINNINDEKKEPKSPRLVTVSRSTQTLAPVLQDAISNSAIPLGNGPIDVDQAQL